MVRTLLERAKPQILEALEKQKVEYPAIAAEVEGYLKSNFYVVELRVGTWMDLKSLWLQATGQHVESPWDFFEED